MPPRPARRVAPCAIAARLVPASRAVASPARRRRARPRPHASRQRARAPHARRARRRRRSAAGVSLRRSSSPDRIAHRASNTFARESRRGRRRACPCASATALPSRRSTRTSSRLHFRGNRCRPFGIRAAAPSVASRRRSCVRGRAAALVCRGQRPPSRAAGGARDLAPARSAALRPLVGGRAPTRPGLGRARRAAAADPRDRRGRVAGAARRAGGVGGAGRRPRRGAGATRSAPTRPPRRARTCRAELERGLRVDAQRRRRRPRLAARPDGPAVGAASAGSARPPTSGPRADDRRTRGQASIEVLGLLPLVAVVALVAFTVVASHTAGEQAGEAAEAGALVLLQGGGRPAHGRRASRAPRGRPAAAPRSPSPAAASTSASARASPSRSRASPTASPAKPTPTPARSRMTALARALGWFIAPPPRRRRASALRARPAPRVAARRRPSHARAAPRRRCRLRRRPRRPPVACRAAALGADAPVVAPRVRVAPPRGPRRASPRRARSPRRTRPRRAERVARHRRRRARAASWRAALGRRARPSSRRESPLSDAPLAVTSAAVLGRPREVEPVAAALALALRRETRAKAATVVVVGAVPRDRSRRERGTRRRGGSPRGSRRRPRAARARAARVGAARSAATRSSRRPRGG